MGLYNQPINTFNMGISWRYFMGIIIYFFGVVGEVNHYPLVIKHGNGLAFPL